jgi:ATP-dependent exoDNAse (exonuclease V) beta subunit
MKVDDLLKDPLFKAYYNATIAEWEITTKEACLRGNIIHNELEDSINKSAGNIKLNDFINKGGEKKLFIDKQDLDATELKEKYPEVYLRLNAYINAGFTIFSEKRVWLEEFLIAGTIDVPIIKDNRFVILDWKTNKAELHRTAGYYKKVNRGGVWVKSDEWVTTDETLLAPLNNVPASKFHKYAMQLSLYAYILEQWGYILLKDALEIIHFMPNKRPVLIKIPYLKNEVMLMLQHHKATLTIKK